MAIVLIRKLQFLGKNNLLPACEEGSDRAKELRAFCRSCIEKIRRYVKDGIGDIRMSVMESKTEVVDVRVKEELEPVFEADPLWISEPDSKDVKTEHEEYDGEENTIFLNDSPATDDGPRGEYETCSSSPESTSETLEDPLRIRSSGIKAEPLDDSSASSGRENPPDENTRIRCNLCESSFPSLDEWKRHTVTHTRTNPYKCQSCGKKISKRGRSKLYKCETCEDAPSAKETPPAKSHKCSTCGKSFPLLGSLEKHNLIHIGQAPYTCDACGQTFIFLSQWKQHSLVHTGEKPHECATCGKRFSNSGHLRQHNRTHTGEKPYYCEACGKHFARLYALKTHRLIHNGEKRHKCETCGKTFSEIRSLKRHGAKHSEDAADVKEENDGSS